MHAALSTGGGEGGEGGAGGGGRPCMWLRRVWRALGAIDAEFGAVLAQALLLAFCEEAADAAPPGSTPPELADAPPADATAALVEERPLVGLGPRVVSIREPRGLVGLGRAALDAMLRCGILSAAQLAELLVGADALAHEAYGERVAAAVRALAKR